MSDDTPILLRVPEEWEDERLDRFLAETLPQYSREYLQSLIRAGSVLREDVPCRKPAFRLIFNDCLAITIPQPQPLDLVAEDCPLEVLFEDPDLLVVNKPSGMLTHPAGGFRTGTLVNALLYHCKGQLSGINGVERPGIVHRLDRETSGLLMVAKTDAAHHGLQQQLQARTAKRTYRAIVQGIPTQPSGSVMAPIGRHPRQRDKMAVLPNGRPAMTHWRLEETIHHRFSVMTLNLETGRTHQIRVHMAHIGHPIFADPLYGTGLAQQLKFQSEGQILQAYALTFDHPITGEAMTFEISSDDKFQRAKAFLEVLL